MVASNDGPANAANGHASGNGVNGHADIADIADIAAGLDGLTLTGNGVVYPAPFAGQGEPNYFYPVLGAMPAVPATAAPAAPAARKLKIRVVGGGLAGAAVAGTLARLPDVDLRVYERADKVREAGALIGVMVSAMRSLSRMLSAAGWQRMQALLYRAPGLDGINHRFWRTGEIMARALSPHTPRYMEEGRISRQALHDVLMQEVPAGVMAFGRAVARVEKAQGGPGMDIYFEDGAVETADLVVAADGLYSRIRRGYLPDSTAKYRGRVSYRRNVPMAAVQHIKNLPADTSSWRQNGNVVFLSKLEPGVYSFVTMVAEPQEYADTLRWEHKMGQEGLDRLLHHFKDWDPVISEVVRALPDVDAYPLNAAPWMRDLVRDDAVAFVGDAAHPTAGAYGAGCSFAFADVRALFLSLWRAHTPASPAAYNLPYALHLYNETRRHFLARVEQQIQMDKLDIAYLAAAGSRPEDDAEAIRRYRERFNVNWWILEHDVDARWQEVEAHARHTYGKQDAARDIAAASGVVGD